MQGIQKKKIELLYSKMDSDAVYVCESWGTDNEFRKDTIHSWLMWSKEVVLDVRRMRVANDIWKQVK